MLSSRIWLFSIVTIIFIVFGISITQWAAVDVITIDLTPTMDAELSWFVEDNCAMPCWMGLIPGKSTAQEVEAFIQAADPAVFCCWETSRRSEFDPVTGYIVNGGYSFYWQEYFRPDNSHQLGSYFSIENSTLLFINVEVNEFISPQQIIEALGQPDRVRFSVGLYNDPEIILNYLNSSLRIDIHGEKEGCTLSDMANRFWVDTILYYAPSYSDRINKYLDIFNYFDVPLNTWKDWLAGEVDTFCYEVADGLWEASVTQTAMPFNEAIAIATPLPE